MSCVHRSSEQPSSNSLRVTMKLSYGEFQRTVYHDNLGYIVLETEYRPTTFPLMECVDLNPFDPTCNQCNDNCYKFLATMSKHEATSQPHSKSKSEIIHELEPIINELKEKALLEFHRKRRRDLRDGKKDGVLDCLFIEHVMERRYNARYYQGSGSDAVNWAAALLLDRQRLSNAVLAKFNQLEAVEIKEGDDECSICLRSDDKGDESDDIDQNINSNNHNHIRLPCQHVFHGHCIAMWLKRKRSCPMCRLDITMSKVSGNN